MPSPDAAVAQVARCQHGVVSRDQARLSGLTDRMIHHRVATGRLKIVRPSVLSVVGSQPTWKQALMAACLAAGPGAVVSHRSAAALFGLDGFRPGPIEITVTRGRRPRLAGVEVHTTRDLPRRDLTTIDHVPVTTPTRALIDLSAVVANDRLEDAFDSALRDNLVTPTRLGRRLQSLRSPGRGGTALLAELLEDHEAGATPQSVLERRFLRLVKRLGLPRPVCQLPVRRPDGSRAYLDFAWVAEGVALEVDGHRGHSTRRQRQHDNERSNDLAQADFRRLLRFTWEHVASHQDYVARMLFEALGRAA